jgi:hypothetical protein
MSAFGPLARIVAEPAIVRTYVLGMIAIAFDAGLIAVMVAGLV